jgi:hypothetical protein
MDVKNPCGAYDSLTAKAGTLVHIEGIPFMLAADTEILGREANAPLISEKARPVAR